MLEERMDGVSCADPWFCLANLKVKDEDVAAASPLRTIGQLCLSRPDDCHRLSYPVFPRCISDCTHPHALVSRLAGRPRAPETLGRQESEGDGLPALPQRPWPGCHRYVLFFCLNLLSHFSLLFYSFLHLSVVVWFLSLVNFLNFIFNRSFSRFLHSLILFAFFPLSLWACESARDNHLPVLLSFPEMHVWLCYSSWRHSNSNQRRDKILWWLI